MEKEEKICEIVKEKLLSNETLVLLEIDYGWGYRLYFPGMTETDFIKWWKNFDKIDDTDYETLDGLPGTAYDAEITNEIWTIWKSLFQQKRYMYIQFSTDYGSWLVMPNGDVIESKGFDITEGSATNVYS